MQNIKFGKIVATFGVAGEVIVTHSFNKKTTFKNINLLFVELSKNNLIPYFIAKAKAKNETETYIQFEDVATKEAAKMLVGKNVWLQQQDFKMLTPKNAPISLLDYTVFNNHTNLGKILEVIEQPHQVLLTILYKNNEAYLPLHEETLVKIDHKKNEIHLSLPDGLLEIYE